MKYVRSVDVILALTDYFKDFIHIMSESQLRDIIAHIVMDIPSIDSEEYNWTSVSESLPENKSIVIATVVNMDPTYNDKPYHRLLEYDNNNWYPLPQLTLTSLPVLTKLEDYDNGKPVVTAWIKAPQLYEGELK